MPPLYTRMVYVAEVFSKGFSLQEPRLLFRGYSSLRVALHSGVRSSKQTRPVQSSMKGKTATTLKNWRQGLSIAARPSTYPCTYHTYVRMFDFRNYTKRSRENIFWTLSKYSNQLHSHSWNIVPGRQAVMICAWDGDTCPSVRSRWILFIFFFFCEANIAIGVSSSCTTPRRKEEFYK